MLSYPAALKWCKQVGTAHATGDGLRAMYAQLIGQAQGGDPQLYYRWIKGEADHEIAEQARMLLRDRQKAWDVLMGLA